MISLKFGRLTKDLMVRELAGLFKANNSAIVVNFSKVGANKIHRLKKQLKTSSTRFRVVKNSIAALSAKNAGLEFLEPLLEGTCGIGFCSKDAIAASKAFVTFSKENEGFKICGGYLENRFISTDKIKELAALPSREVLIAKAVGGIKSPISGFVCVLNNFVSGFIRAVDQIAKKKTGGDTNE